jgi:hypothetical protein
VYRTYDQKEEIASAGEECVQKEILVKELDQLFRNLGPVKQQIMDLHENIEGIMLVRCYRKLCEEKKKATSVQMTLDQ